MAKKKEQTKVEYRPPIVTLLGHVDHGKTSILDQIRKTSVQLGEVGGITQSISVYCVTKYGKDISFIDTPGHEAFNLMRQRGGSVADIALLIVAANDSVKPQTRESIQIIKASKVNAIAVINKVDLPDVNIDKVKRDLANEGLIVESMGGDIPCVEVSAKTGKGIDELLDMILLVAEVNGITKTPPIEGSLGEAYVLESFKDKSRGNVSTMIVTAGTFETGNFIVSASDRKIKDKIKGFINDQGKSISKLDQGYGGQVIGLSGSLTLGDKIFCVDAKSKFVPPAKEQQTTAKEEVVSAEAPEVDSNAALSAILFGNKQTVASDLKILKVVIKSSTQGKLDAIMKSLDKINEDGKIIDVVHKGVGDLSLSDVELAHNLGAIVIGFEVKADKQTLDFAEKNKILIRIYALIYELVEELEDASLALQQPETEEKVIGTAKVKKVFVLSDGSKVFGLRVESGEIKSGSQCRFIRGKDQVCKGKIKSMRSGKDQVNSVTPGAECGVQLDAACDAQEGDTFETFTVVKA